MNLKDLDFGYNPDGFELHEMVGRYAMLASLEGYRSSRFVLNYGMKLEAVNHYSFFEKSYKNSKESNEVTAKLEGSFGSSLTYELGLNKFYTAISRGYRLQYNDFQRQDRIWHVADDNLSFGADVHLGRYSLANLELSGQNADWGSSFAIKGAFKNRGLNIGMNYERKNSDYERFIPDSEEYGIRLSYRKDSTTITVIGAEIDESYKDAQEEKNYKMESRISIDF